MALQRLLCPLSILQALLPAGTFALGVAASSLVRHKRSTFPEEAEVNAVATIGRLLENFHQKYGEEDCGSDQLDSFLS